MAPSTNARQLLAEQDIRHPRAANGGFHQHHPMVIVYRFPDNASVALTFWLEKMRSRPPVRA